MKTYVGAFSFSGASLSPYSGNKFKIFMYIAWVFARLLLVCLLYVFYETQNCLNKNESKE